MADKLTSGQFAELSRLNIRNRITRVATLTNDSGLWGLSNIKSWGKIKYEVYNKHPSDRGRLSFPVMTLTADNSEGYFNHGGTVFPNGKSDILTTEIRVQMVIKMQDGVFINVLDFEGQLREPEYDSSKEIQLVIEHPLTVLTGRKWTRSDRVGGDTGVDWFFN